MSNLHLEACLELCGVPPFPKSYTDFHALYIRIYVILFVVYHLYGMHYL